MASQFPFRKGDVVRISDADHIAEHVRGKLAKVYKFQRSGRLDKVHLLLENGEQMELVHHYFDMLTIISKEEQREFTK